jgi:hypothetical protein
LTSSPAFAYAAFGLWLVDNTGTIGMADVPALSKIQYTASMKKMDLQHQYTVPKAYRYLSG